MNTQDEAVIKTDIFVSELLARCREMRLEPSRSENGGLVTVGVRRSYEELLLFFGNGPQTPEVVNDLTGDSTPFLPGWSAVAPGPASLAMDIGCWVASKPRPTYVKHYKGGIYRVVARAKSENTQQDLAVYESVPSGEVWVRPWEEFMSFVLLSDLPKVGQFRRFQPIDV